jgi:hypothetical protein
VDLITETQHPFDLIIAAFDPGNTTGLAVFADEPINGQRLFMGQGTKEEIWQYMDFVTAWGRPVLWVVEDTRPRPGHVATWQPSGCRMTGVIEYYACRRGERMILQSPATAKSFSTDQRLKLLTWWVPGKEHANDAARHLLLAMAVHHLPGWAAVSHVLRTRAQEN